MTILIEDILKKKICELIYLMYRINGCEIEVVPTPQMFSGDFTFNTFPLSKLLRKNPLEIASTISNNLVSDNIIKEAISEKAYINITLQDNFLLKVFEYIIQHKHYGISEPESLNKTIMVEYSSPNTNKPLHLGHIRNNLIGHSISELYKAIGYKVIKTTLINDRGIHICKSMLAWQKWGNGETPESSGIKGDHLVGKYYVLFDKEYKKQVESLKSASISEDEAEKNAPILLEAKAMLKLWEDGDMKILALWKLMNGWVYKGFEATYKELGISFDVTEYESETYKLGKSVVMDNFNKGLVEKENDGALWVDFTELGLDRKLLLRGNGTSVYITQDIGTAIRRKRNYDVEKFIYVVAVEQQYHFKVLKQLLKYFGFTWYDDIFHLSYEMVDLPSGRMKSREGTVVDADDLMQEMTTLALKQLNVREKQPDVNLAKTVGLGSLKYQIIKIDPQKKILFDPFKTIDFQGNSGAFIQYTFARIKSVLRLVNFSDNSSKLNIQYGLLNREEKELILQLYLFKSLVEQAAKNHNPSLIANYLFDLSQKFNHYYHAYKINTDNKESKLFRLLLSDQIAKILKSGANLLGIQLPEKM